jgi:HEAT repeat protein
MNQILEWLLGGDLRSDGLSAEVAAFVLDHPELIDELMDGLEEEKDLVRGRTADALEKIARSEPGLVEPYLARLIAVADRDSVAMVKMHIAMLLGHLTMFEDHTDLIQEALVGLLEDKGVFARSWAIASLSILGRQFPERREGIVNSIARLGNDESIAIRTRVRKALKVLTDDRSDFPKGWIKSEHLLSK